MCAGGVGRLGDEGGGGDAESRWMVDVVDGSMIGDGDRG